MKYKYSPGDILQSIYDYKISYWLIIASTGQAASGPFYYVWRFLKKAKKNSLSAEYDYDKCTFDDILWVDRSTIILSASTLDKKWKKVGSIGRHFEYLSMFNKKSVVDFAGSKI